MNKRLYKRVVKRLVKNLVFNIIPRKKNILITCSGKKDGTGAQIQAIYSTILYSVVNNKEFIHTPLSVVEHNYENSIDWENRIEEFFCIKEITTPKSTDSYKVYNLDNLSIISYLKISTSRRPILVQKKHFHEFADKNPEYYDKVMSNIRAFFFKKNIKYKRNEAKDQLIVSYHIRRGDVSMNTNNDRYTSNELISENIKILISFLQDSKLTYEIHIYSQGEEKDFGEISKLGILHLNEDIFDTIYNLADSDVLFMSKSSFSYLSGLLSKGVVMYEPFWHSALPNWHVLNSDLSLNKDIQEKIKTAFDKKITNVS